MKKRTPYVATGVAVALMGSSVLAVTKSSWFSEPTAPTNLATLQEAMITAQRHLPDARIVRAEYKLGSTHQWQIAIEMLRDKQTLDVSIDPITNTFIGSKIDENDEGERS